MKGPSAEDAMGWGFVRREGSGRGLCPHHTFFDFRAQNANTWVLSLNLKMARSDGPRAAPLYPVIYSKRESRQNK